MGKLEPPFHPIIYLRGYAMSMSEIEDTVADPYMGFNLGSTKIRQRWDGRIVKYIFESPLVRLMKEHGYCDVYAEGDELTQTVPARSLWIFRYYERSSRDLGTGKVEGIEDFAARLGSFVERVRDATCGAEAGASERVLKARKAFRVYLVAHSMGGLIARCYLQTVAGRDHPVDKVFTYGTPHGGIDLRGIGNVPSLVKIADIDNFSEPRMRQYLRLNAKESVTSLGGKFDASRFFCLVGTNHRDYGAAMGVAQRAVGPMSDGLVLIKNAAVDGAPRAFVHRAHSGHYGIVNSEEGYQNLKRFLFGNLRVETFLEVDDISLPADLEKKRVAGKKIQASYHLEVVARVRGKRWDLHRRTVNEDSALFVPFERLLVKRSLHLASAFLMDAERVDMRRQGLGFSLDLGILVPEYEVDGALFLKHHFDGGYLFRDKINLEVKWPVGEKPQLLYGFDSVTPNRTNAEAAVLDLRENGDLVGYSFRVPVRQDSRPGLSGTLVLQTAGWH